MSKFWPIVFLPLVVFAAPRHDLQQALPKVPVRFERSGTGEFVGKGFGYRVALSATGYAVSIPDAGREHLVRVSLPGANPAVAGQPEMPLAMKTSYIHGSERSKWRTGVASFARIRYEQVLPGIDVVYHGAGDQLEFDFVVRQGADPRLIVMRYEGQDDLVVDRDGNLRIAAAGQEIVQELPVVYQRIGESMRLISGSYSVVGAGKVAFELGPYDKTQPLVIDPVVVYSNFVGGAGTDGAIAIQRDKAGYLYVAGNTRSTDLPVVNAFSAVANGDQDIFVMKIDPKAASPNDVLVLTYVGATGTDEVRAMTVDPASGAVFLTGFTTSTDFPMVNAAQATLAGDKDAFVAKLDINGTGGLAYSTFFGGTAADVGTAITLDDGGNAYIAGYTTSGDLPFTSDAAQPGNLGGYDAFVAIYGSGGNKIYATYLGGKSTDMAQAVAVAADGSVVIAGSTLSDNLPLAGNSYDANFHDGGGDGFIARIIPNKGLDGFVYATYFGGNGIDDIRAIAFNPAGQLVVAGYTGSTDLPVTVGAIQAQNLGSLNLFVSILDIYKPNQSALIYTTYLGGSVADILYGFRFDPAGRILLTGYTYSTDFPVTPSALQSQNAGAPDMFATRIDLSKTGAAGLVYSTYIGGVNNDIGHGIEQDASGNIFVVGSTNNRQFPAGAGDRGSTPGDTDAVVIGIQPGAVTLSTNANTVDAAGGDAFSFLVTAASDITWEAVTSATWISVRSGAAGNGNGSVAYSVAANEGGGARTGTLRVAGQTYTVTQSGGQ